VVEVDTAHGWSLAIFEHHASLTRQARTTMTRRRLGTVYAGGLPSNINSVSPPEQLAMMPRVWDLSSAEIFDH